VRVLDGSSNEPQRVAVLQDGRERGSIAIPEGVTRAAIDAGLREVLWHPNGRDVAIAFKGAAASFVVVFLDQPGGVMRPVDVSQVERTNIGGIGPFRTYVDRRTRPVEWLGLARIEALGSRYDRAEAVQIRLRTEVWDEAGTRYVGTEPLIITRDGVPLWR
jgi:hypothetical protein